MGLIDKFIKTAKVLTLLNSNSTSISISNRDVGSVSWTTSRFEIEIEVEFEFELLIIYLIEGIQIIYYLFHPSECKSRHRQVRAHFYKFHSKYYCNPFV